jgi:hypothetical protein
MALYIETDDGHGNTYRRPRRWPTLPAEIVREITWPDRPRMLAAAEYAALTGRS